MIKPIDTEFVIVLTKKINCHGNKRRKSGKELRIGAATRTEIWSEKEGTTAKNVEAAKQATGSNKRSAVEKKLEGKK